MKSYWTQTSALSDLMPSCGPLTSDASADVAVVGGGMAGLTTAYLLMKAGKSVCLLEAGEIASGESSRTTAQFVTALDERYFEIERLHGAKGARLAAESHVTAIERVAQIVREESIDCDLEWQNGYLFSQGDPREGLLERELLAARRAGLLDLVLLNRAPVHSFNTGECLRFPRQLQLHPLKYMAGLARALLRGGARLFAHSPVTEFQGGERAFVRTESGAQVRCGSIVVATHTPVNDLFAIHTKQAAYRTYVVSFPVPKNSVMRAMYWDTLKPYHYVRVESFSSTHDLLIVGGEDHKTGQDEQPERRFEALEAWTRARFPIGGAPVSQWSGQVFEPIDGLAFLGHNPLDRKNVYVITGLSGNGMTHATIGALLITDQIRGRAHPWEQLYNPSRLNLRAAKTFLKENLNVAAQYGEWFDAKPRPDLSRLEPGEGTVYREGLKMIAVYKEPSGVVRHLSAVCPHLAGVVHWNSAEKSWDCPCHGSRFDCHGKLLEGPALSDLKPLAEPAPRPHLLTNQKDFLPEKKEGANPHPL